MPVFKIELIELIVNLQQSTKHLPLDFCYIYGMYHILIQQTDMLFFFFSTAYEETPSILKACIFQSYHH